MVDRLGRRKALVVTVIGAALASAFTVSRVVSNFMVCV